MAQARKWSQRSLRLFLTIVDGMSEYSGLVCAFAIFVSACAIVHMVLVRKLLGIPTIWQVEFAVFNLVMATFVGAAFGQKHDAHLSVDFLITRFPHRMREIFMILCALTGIVICGVIAYYAWPLWWEALVEGHHTSSLWSPPLAWPYILLPLGMTAMALQYVAYTVREISRVRKTR